MSKIKESVVRFWENVREGFWRFVPFHVGAVALAVVNILTIHKVIKGDRLALDLLRGIGLGMLAGVFARQVADRLNKKNPALYSWIVTIAVSALGIAFWRYIDRKSLYYWLWTMLYSGTAFAIFSACVAMLYSPKNENTLFSKLWVNFLVVFGSGLFVAGGLCGCIGAFDALITKVNSKIYGDVMSIVLTAASPIVFMSILPGRDSADDGSRRAGDFLFRRVLPVTLVLLAILYVYLVKIIVTGTMPGGHLNWFGSIALAVYVFFWLALNGTEHRFTGFVIRRGWIFLVPVLIAQIVAVVIRLSAYGLTAERMSGIIVLAVGIYALILAALGRRHVTLFWVFAVAGIIFTVTPLNIADIPVRNQECRLRAALERSGCISDGEFSIPENVSVADADAKIIVGAWDYLSRAHTVWYRADFAEKVRKATDGNLISGLSINTGKIGPRSEDEYRCLHFRPEGEVVPIEGYTSVKWAGRWDIAVTASKEDNGMRYFIKVQLAKDANEKEKFDVTENIEKIFKASGFDGNICKSGSKTANPELFIWKLKPGVALAVCEMQVSQYNDTPVLYYLSKIVLLYGGD